MRRRAGFTLVELLAACGVFLFGATAAIGLMTVGTRARAQADGLLRLGLAASSIVAEIGLEAAVPATGEVPPPSAFVGDGFPATADAGMADPESLDAPLIAYRPQPGIWYRVLEASDPAGGDDAAAPVVRLDLLVAWNPVPDASLTLRELAARHRLDRRREWDASDDQRRFLIDYLVQRGLAVHETHWILRRPAGVRPADAEEP